MASDAEFEIFLVVAPGLEPVLADEARALGLRDARPIPGGVTVRGGWQEVWRANLRLRGASRVLARIGAFRALHLAQLDKRARRFGWGDVLRPDVPVRVEATCRKSRIYHSGAAAERIGRAIREELGAPLSEAAEVVIKARIDDDLCSLAVDTSGEPLHKRGAKQAVAKAPLRETMAALYLRACAFRGDEPVLDPMCGSGTFVLEAAEISAGLAPGRSRSFAFEQLATFDPAAWRSMREAGSVAREPGPQPLHHGSDHDAGAVRMAVENAARAGVSEWTQFRQLDIAAVERPPGPPGLVIVNPPYGERIGETARLPHLYRTLGRSLEARFAGWRVGLLTSDPALAEATGLPFGPPLGPVLHGGLRVHLFRTGPLA